MSCKSPKPVWHGQNPLTLKSYRSYTPIVGVPESRQNCNQCLGCRLANARDWGVRGLHESVIYDPLNCSFITLTLDDKSLEAENFQLRKKFIPEFMKRLRKNTGKKLSILYCGEYGDKTFRPHYHAIIFGENFKDSMSYREYKESNTGETLWNSKILDDAHQNRGHAVIGNVTFESCAYVGGYVVKKQKGTKTVLPHRYDANGKFIPEKTIDNPEKYFINPETGECLENQFSDSSNRPALGKRWLYRYLYDVYPNDRVVLPTGMEIRPPRYYDDLAWDVDPRMMRDVVQKRKDWAADKSNWKSLELLQRELRALKNTLKYRAAYAQV